MDSTPSPVSRISGVPRPHERSYNGRSVKILGVTGTIGSGKSTVCRILSTLGCPVLDADVEAHLSYRPGTRAYRQLVAEFGEAIIDAAGRIDRTVLGQMVFSSADRRDRLNAIVHPATRRRVRGGLSRLRSAGHKWVALEATLLIEAGWLDMVDRLWVVVAPDDLVVTRLQRDRGLDEHRIRERLATQLPASRMMELADDIICNDSDVAALHARVESLWREMTDAGRTAAA